MIRPKWVRPNQTTWILANVDENGNLVYYRYGHWVDDRSRANRWTNGRRDNKPSGYRNGRMGFLLIERPFGFQPLRCHA